MDLAKANRIGQEYSQGFAKGWAPVADGEMPDGCTPCKLCGKRCMSAEWIHEGDWHARGPVVRITALCDAAMDLAADPWDNDLIRTEFAPAAEAVAEWNEMNNRPGAVRRIRGRG